MRNERKVFGDGYCVVWAIYSSLYVVEKVGHYSFNFDNIIYGTGGNMGLFLGWSLKSIYEHNICKMNSKRLRIPEGGTWCLYQMVTQK